MNVALPLQLVDREGGLEIGGQRGVDRGGGQARQPLVELDGALLRDAVADDQARSGSGRLAGFDVAAEKRKTLSWILLLSDSSIIAAAPWNSRLFTCTWEESLIVNK